MNEETAAPGRNGGTLSPWKKGQSGNPSGRPKGSRNIKSLLQKLMALDVPAKTLKKLNLRDNLTNQEAIAWQQVKSALSGNLKAAKWIADRCDGPVGKLDEEPEPSQFTFDKEALDQLSKQWEAMKKGIPKSSGR